MGVGLVCKEMQPGSGPTKFAHLSPVGIDQWNELRVVTAVSGCDGELDRSEHMIDQRMDLGGQPTTRPAQTMIIRLGRNLVIR